MTAIATWVNSSTDCPNCAHVKYWETWNEFDRNSLNSGDHPSWYAAQTGCVAPCPTPDQLIRMAQDARCIIVGSGYVDNYPNSGDHTPCSTVGPGIDPTAEIVQPSISALGKTDALKCFLYCDQNACNNWFGAQCVNTHNQGQRHGADAIDIVNYHDYAPTNNPEDHSTTALRNALQSQELSKPLWVGEGSWSDSLASTNFWQDRYAQGGFIPRWFAAHWSQTLPTGSTPCSWTGQNAQVCQQTFWYGYDYDTSTADQGFLPHSVGALYCPGKTTHGYCSPPPNYTPFLITPQANMWNVAVDWLTGAVPNASGSNPFCNKLGSSSTVWHCDFTKGGSNYSMVWDNQYAQTGNNFCTSDLANPYICGDTTYNVPAQFQGGHWIDLNPTITYRTGTTVTIGLNPILLVAP